MKGDKDEGFVDIVAKGGQEWIRMYRYVSHFSSGPGTTMN
jgi:hypothetical protein